MGTNGEILTLLRPLTWDSAIVYLTISTYVIIMQLQRNSLDVLSQLWIGATFNTQKYIIYVEWI